MLSRQAWDTSCSSTWSFPALSWGEPSGGYTGLQRMERDTQTSVSRIDDRQHTVHVPCAIPRGRSTDEE